MYSLAQLIALSDKIRNLSDKEILKQLLSISLVDMTEQQLNSAYRKGSLLLHPDRYKAEEEKKLATAIFKRLTVAKDNYFVALSDADIPSPPVDMYNRADMEARIRSLAEPARSKLIKNMFWVHQLFAFGISLDQLLALEPMFFDEVISPVGHDIIIKLGRHGITMSQIQALPTLMRHRIMHSYAEDTLALIELGIPFKTLTALDVDKMKQLQRASSTLKTLSDEHNVRIKNLLFFEPSVINTLCEHVNSIRRHIKIISSDAPHFVNFPSIINELLELRSTNVRDELLCSLYQVVEITQKYHIPLEDLVNLEPLVRELLFKQYYTMSPLLQAVHWHSFKVLTPTVQTELLNLGSNFAHFIKITQFSLLDIAALESSDRIYLIENIRFYIQICEYNHLGWNDLFSSSTKNTVEQCKNITKTCKSEGFSTHIYIWHEYLISLIHDDLKNTIDALLEVAPQQRVNIFKHGKVMVKLVNEGRVPFKSLPDLFSLDQVLINQLNNPACLHALSNGVLTVDRLLQMTAQELENANEKGDFTITMELEITDIEPPPLPQKLTKRTFFQFFGNIFSTKATKPRDDFPNNGGPRSKK